MLNRRIAALICFALLMPLVLVCAPNAALGRENPGAADAASFSSYAASASSFTAFAASPGLDASVTTWSELKDWMDQNGDTGGTVRLGANIELWQNDTYGLYAENWVTIETGQYGIIVTNGAQLSLTGNVRLRGDGAPAPVLTICGDGRLYIRNSNECIATGANGVALCFEDGAEYNYMMQSRPLFSAQGADGVAIRSERKLDLDWHDIDATGPRGVGIDCTKPVSLFFCRVNTSGDAVLSPDTTLDTCAVSSPAPGANVIRRRVSKMTPTRSATYARKVGEPVIISDTLSCVLSLRDENDPENIRPEIVDAIFDGEERIYTVPGDYIYPATLPSIYADFDIAPLDGSLGLDIIIYDPTIPFFENIRNVLIEGGGFYYITYHYSKPELEPLTLWRSDDNGKTWRISWKEGYADNEAYRAIWFDNSLTLYYYLDDISDGMLLAFEYEGRGGSYVVKIKKDEILVLGTGSGDRDGGDRLPWSVFLGNPADPSDGNDSGNGGSNGNGNGGDKGSGDSAVGDGATGGGSPASSRGVSASAWLPLPLPAPTHDLILAPNAPAENESDAGNAAIVPNGRGANSVTPPAAASTQDEPPNGPLSNPPGDPLRTLPETTEQTENPAEGGAPEDAGKRPPPLLSEPNAGQPGGASPLIAVAAGVLSVGGAGGLAYRFRKHLTRAMRRR